MTKEREKGKNDIEALVNQLSPCNQAYILNTIDALLYSQKMDGTEKKTLPETVGRKGK